MSETYVQPNTLTNDDGEEYDVKIVCSHEGRKKMDDRAANVMNVSMETDNRTACGDIGGNY